VAVPVTATISIHICILDGREQHGKFRCNKLCAIEIDGFPFRSGSIDHGRSQEFM
jgi:hypothetical protein